MQEDQAMEFFDEIFECIQPSYRKIEEETDKPKQKVKQPKGKKQVDAPSRSLLEIGERANAKISQIRKENADKSVAKLKEIHAAKGAYNKNNKDSDDEMVPNKMGAVMMGSEDEEMDFAKAQANNKKDKEEKKKHVNKGALSEIKLKNKRKMKEATKKIKVKRQKGMNPTVLNQKDKRQVKKSA